MYSNSYFTNWHNNILCEVGVNEMLISEKSNRDALCLLKGVLVNVMYNYAGDFVHLGLDGFFTKCRNTKEVVLISSEGAGSSAKDKFLINPTVHEGSLYVKCGAWIYLYDTQDNYIIYSNDKVSYFVGDPGIACVYIFGGINFFRMHAGKTISRSNAVKIYSVFDAFVGAGTRLYSGSFRGVYSVILNTQIGASFFRRASVWSYAKILEKTGLKPESSPLIVFELSIGRYINFGTSFYIAFRKHWTSFLWEGKVSSFLFRDNSSVLLSLVAMI
ncbi:MAG: hypothetical protein KAH32_04070 [Chlamydiia bacterium]|nr:hypothetical protein [Chlamydiia bacterium]